MRMRDYGLGRNLEGSRRFSWLDLMSDGIWGCLVSESWVQPLSIRVMY